MHSSKKEHNTNSSEWTTQIQGLLWNLRQFLAAAYSLHINLLTVQTETSALTLSKLPAKPVCII